MPMNDFPVDIGERASVFGFVDQGHHYKLVVTQIPQDAGMSPIRTSDHEVMG